MEKQRDKAARRLQRKLEKQQGAGAGPEIEAQAEAGEFERPSEEEQA
ncbi:MAG: hypothetical protein ACE15B_10230 [Bryobacteraceae bacterium]